MVCTERAGTNWTKSTLSVAEPVSQAVDSSTDFKTKIEGILEDSGFREQRAAKMDINEILKYVQYILIRAIFSDLSIQATLRIP